MSAANENLLYNQVVRVTHVYLGPAAERFISRQVQNHLGKEPKDITRRDLAKLITWISLSVSLLTDDSEIIEEYISQLEKLADDSSGEA
jgi:hypothetical protein